MANALNVKIGGDIAGLEKALSSATAQIRNAGKQMTSIGKTISTRVSAPLIALGGIAVRQAGKFESLRTSMDTLNGSVEEGARNFERLQEFSARTPFQLQDLASAQNMLQGFGMAADDAFESLSMIGDIAAISGGSIEGIGVAFGQAAAEGRLMTRDIRQLINQGVPAIKLLADTMGVAQSEVLDLASEGEISFEILQQAFRDATNEGGMFADGMEKQSKTINGLFSTLKDNVSLALGELGSSIVDAFSLREAIPALIENIQNITDWFKRLSDESKRSIIILTTAIAGIGPALVTAGIAVSAFGVVLGALTSPITLTIGAISGIVLALEYVRRNLDVFINRIKIGFAKVREIVINEVDVILEAIQAWSAWLPGNMDVAVLQARASLRSLSDDLPELKGEFQSFGEFFKSIGSDIVDIFENISGIKLRGMFTGVKEEAQIASQAIQGSMFNATFAIRQFSTIATEDINKVPSALQGMSQSMVNAIGFARGIADQFTSSFGQGMANVVVQGQNLISTLKNIGKLLASAVIQKGLSALLSGGLGGSGFFGSGGGLFGKIFGVNDALITSGGDVVKFHPDDNILAMKDFSGIGGGGTQRVEVFGTLKGQDLFVSSDRGGETYGR